jgi:hypothetical protein
LAQGHLRGQKRWLEDELSEHACENIIRSEQKTVVAVENSFQSRKYLLDNKINIDQKNTTARKHSEIMLYYCLRMYLLVVLMVTQEPVTFPACEEGIP